MFNKINGKELNTMLTMASGDQWKRIRYADFIEKYLIFIEKYLIWLHLLFFVYPS